MNVEAVEGNESYVLLLVLGRRLNGDQSRIAWGLESRPWILKCSARVDVSRHLPGRHAQNCFKKAIFKHFSLAGKPTSIGLLRRRPHAWQQHVPSPRLERRIDSEHLLIAPAFIEGIRCVPAHAPLLLLVLT